MKVNLKGVDIDLVEIINAALNAHPGRIFSGMRTAAEQMELYAAGISPVTMSKHMEGLAVDVVLYDPRHSGKVADWRFEQYAAFNETVQTLAAARKVVITWGGTWKSRDGVHFQIERPVPIVL